MTQSQHSNSLEGTLLAIRYQDPENDFVSLDVLTGDETLVRATGTYPNPVEGEELTLEGTYSRHKGVARVFQFIRFRARPPAGMEAQIRYLSELCDIQSDMARKLIERFGDDVVGILETNPDLLAQIEGVSHDFALAMQQRYLAQKAQDRLGVLLEQMGVGKRVLHKLRQKLGHGQVDAELRENPYLLTLHADYPFGPADQLAKRLNVHNHPDRLAAAIVAILNHRAKQGHTSITYTELCNDLAPVMHQRIDIEDPVLTQALKQLRKMELVVRLDDRLVLHTIYHAETDIQKALYRLNQGERQYDTGLDLGWVVQRLHPIPEYIEPLTFIESVLRNKILTIDLDDERLAKEALLILKQLFSHLQAEVTFCCPGRGDAATLSRWLQVNVPTPAGLLQDTGLGQLAYRSDRPLSTDCLILYRSESLSTPRLAQLLAALPEHACCILIGDHRLLSPAGPGDPYRTLLNYDSIAHLSFTFPSSKNAPQLDILKDHVKLGLTPPLSSATNKASSVWMFDATVETVPRIVSVLVRDVLPKFDRGEQPQCLIYGIGPKAEREQWLIELQQRLYSEHTPVLLNGLTVYPQDVLWLKTALPEFDLSQGTPVKIIDIKRGPSAIIQPMGTSEKYVLEGPGLSHLGQLYFESLNYPAGTRVDTVMLVCIAPYATQLHVEQLYYAARIAKKRLVLIGDTKNILNCTQYPRVQRQCGLQLLLANETSKPNKESKPMERTA